MMKKIIASLLGVSLCLSLFAGCGKVPAAPTTEPETTVGSTYETSLELLNAVWEGIPEAERFPAGGGDEAQPADGPGSFDMEVYAESFQYLILVDNDLMDKLSGDAATLMHMMNTNTFCSAAMRLKNSQDAESFAQRYKELVQSNQWMCGFPDTVVVLNLGEYVLTAYGKEAPIQSFKNAALALDAQLLVEAPAEL